MRVGDRVEYVGEGWIGQALMKTYPEGAVVLSISDDEIATIRWPSGGWMIVGEPAALRVTQTLEEIFAAG